MECIKCKVSFNEQPLHRTTPLGNNKPEWMCMPCIENTEPELAENIKEDSEFMEVLGLISQS